MTFLLLMFQFLNNQMSKYKYAIYKAYEDNPKLLLETDRLSAVVNFFGEKRTGNIANWFKNSATSWRTTYKDHVVMRFMFKKDKV